MEIIQTIKKLSTMFIKSIIEKKYIYIEKIGGFMILRQFQYLHHLAPEFSLIAVVPYH